MQSSHLRTSKRHSSFQYLDLKTFFRVRTGLCKERLSSCLMIDLFSWLSLFGGKSIDSNQSINHILQNMNFSTIFLVIVILTDWRHIWLRSGVLPSHPLPPLKVQILLSERVFWSEKCSGSSQRLYLPSPPPKLCSKRESLLSILYLLCSCSGSSAETAGNSKFIHGSNFPDIFLGRHPGQRRICE